MANKSRPKQLSFRVSEEEWELLQQKISESGMNQQQYILSCVLGKEIVNTDGIKEIVPELKRQGANLNQIAKRLNERGYIDYKKELPTVLDEVKMVWQSLRQNLQKLGINTVLDYVMQEEKTEQKLLSGLNCVPDTVKDEMRVTKLLWDKDGGRTYKHFVQSFAPGEKINPAQAHQIACQLAASRPEWQDFEVLIATHEDKEHIHTHFVVNSVSYVDGHKLQQSKAELQAMKDYSDQLCAKYGLHITEKGKTFDGQEREETVAFSKDTYQLLKKAEQGEVKSYVQDIALAILDCREQATNRTDFVQRMNERGYGVDWQDSHKYITFTDLKRQEQGEKQCKIRNNKLEKYYNMDFGKENLEHEFEGNARSQQTAQRAREQLAADRGAKTDNRTAEADNIGAFIANIAAQVGNAEAGRQERAAERNRRSAGDTERECRAKEAKRAAEASMRRHRRDDLEL